MDMYLVWGSGRIFLKPIPRFILSPDFWRAHLRCQDGCDCSKGQKQCTTKTLRRIALGFLLTYAALLSHESDFVIAKDKGLLPKEGDLPKWADWRKFVKEILAPTVYKDIHRRFYYGELRLGRLNAIYVFYRFGYYMNQWPNYASFLRDQLGWLAATTIYIALVLTAMQVGLATDQLKANDQFMTASYGFSVLAIMGPLVGGITILLVLVVLVVINWKFEKVKSAKRFEHIEGKGGVQV
ncbi:uncharacterized protein Z519_09244 [Cladophialophora bantiana CBS 173.52]|uniref:Uncharacterized protein n=1 Tax=Cladophialophora bantiana (strain ATCC 10958 / CBS 173.52 / CDC B-1940 / NIH 8579) TaxID=1442370 RepID=A0A0D2HG83_CLAB1|nr:uncharacterized protein Z519_09244 [Cladophialophora bantiana CBS 173.52]KIW89815.1 hypothetical protein Z519_09244 [Cladophialophora bantiana CBS 173.52]